MILFQKYKRMIRDAGYEDLLKTKHWAYNTLAKKYIDPSDTDLKSHPEISTTVEERLEKLKKLWEETHDIIKDKQILDKLEQLILIGDNQIKYKDILSDRHYMSYDTADGKRLFISIYNGDFYLFDNNTYNVEAFCPNSLISNIRVDEEEVEIAEYQQNYAKPRKPVDDSLMYQSGSYMKEKAKSDYQRNLAKYQADLIAADAHNREEDKKHMESIGRTRKIKYIYIGFYANEEAKLENKVEEVRYEYKFLGLWDYLCKKLPNIEKYDSTKQTQIGKYTYDGKTINGYKVIGSKDIGYINILNDSEIKKIKTTNNSFEINFQEDYKVILKKYSKGNIEKIAKEYKKLKLETCLNAEDLYDLHYFSFPYEFEAYAFQPKGSTEEYFEEVLFEDANKDIIYIYSNYKGREMWALNLAYTYYANDSMKLQIKKEEYNLIEIRK